MPTTQQMQSISAHQRRIDEIDQAVKLAEKFLDRKGYLNDDSGKRVLLTIEEMLAMRLKEEQAINELR